MQKLRQLTLVFVLTAVAFSLNTTLSAANKMLKYVPRSAKLIVNVDVKTILNCQTVKTLLKDAESDPDYIEFQSKLKQYGLKMDGIAKEVMIFAYGKKSKPSFGLLANTKVNEKILKKFLDSEFADKSTGGSYQLKSIKGKPSFIFKAPPIENPMVTQALSSNEQLQEDQVLSFIKPNIALFCPKSGIEKIFSDIKKKKTASRSSKIKKQLKSVNTDAVIWGVFEVDPKSIMGDTGQPGGGANPPAMPNPAENIRGGSFSLNLEGETKEDISIKTCLRCKDAQSANMLQMQMSGLVMMVSGMGFQKDPQLGMELAQALKFEAKDTNVLIKANLTKVLIDKLKAYSEKIKKEKAQGGPQPLPPQGQKPAK